MGPHVSLEFSDGNTALRMPFPEPETALAGTNLVTGRDKVVRYGIRIVSGSDCVFTNFQRLTRRLNDLGAMAGIFTTEDTEDTEERVFPTSPRDLPALHDPARFTSLLILLPKRGLRGSGLPAIINQ